MSSPSITYHKNKPANGFTILELAIVLVIIGLIIAGVFVGQDVIRSAQIRGVLGEYDVYIRSLQQFQDKYNAMPGDMSNASSLFDQGESCTAYCMNNYTNCSWNGSWCDGGGACGMQGDEASCNATTYWSSCSGDDACGSQADESACTSYSYSSVCFGVIDGDGDGRIGSATYNGGQGNVSEWFQAWVHLKGAKLVDGTFTGTPGSGAIPNVNVPASKVTGGGWTLNYYIQTETMDKLWGGSYGHMLWFGESIGDHRIITAAPVLTASEAYGIDTKIDDGKPGVGNILSWRSHYVNSPAPQCITSASDSAIDSSLAVYNELTSGNICSLIFKTGY